jgi:uncharacterized protein (DUF427 family)
MSNHRITVEPAGVRVQIKLRGEIIADTKNAIRLSEGSYPAVYYIPRADVKMERLVRSSHHTHCPFKGEASYFSFVGGAENAVWSYEQPFDQVLAIKELLAFYPNQVEQQIL